MNDYFHFKQFSVCHKRSSMKVGTDGVLLGAWANVAGVKTVLDVGTGTGVIALMVAQRSGSDTMIDAVEIHDEAVRDAQENFSNSPWANRIHLHHTTIQAYQEKAKYDLIIANPPYFINSYKPSVEERSIARHTESLTFEDLLQAAAILLQPQGRLAVILPVTEGQLFKTIASTKNLHCIREWNFRTRKNKPIERLLFEFSRNPSQLDHGEILLYQSGEEWSEGYRNLTKYFYLKL